MRVYPDRLDEQLKRRLAPIYIVAGDEPLMHMEACDAIREAARARGVEEREILQVEPNFEWHRLSESASHLSLFASARLLELRLGGQSPGQEGARSLEAYAEGTDTGSDILLISAARLDRRTQQSKWFKTLESRGVYVPVWPIDYQRLHFWVRDRAGRHGIELDPEGARLLAERTEGNLLAADQALIRLSLVHPPGSRLNARSVAADTEESSRFDVFTLTDACLRGERERAVRIVNGLRQEGIEAPVVLWALTRELRTLLSIRQHMDQGQSLEQACKAQRPLVPEKRRPHYQKALNRLPLKRLHKLLLLSQRLDLAIKGALALPVWDSLADLALTLAGGRGPLAEMPESYRIRQV